MSAAVPVRVERDVLDKNKYKIIADDIWVGPFVSDKELAERISEFVYSAIAEGEIEVKKP